MAARFPFVAATSGRGDASLMPIVPLELRFQQGKEVEVQGLLDSGATGTPSLVRPLRQGHLRLLDDVAQAAGLEGADQAG